MAPVEDEGASRSRGLWLLLCLVCLAAGIAVLVWPGRTLLVVAFLFGLELVVAGGVAIALAAGWLLDGLAAVVAGLRRGQPRRERQAPVAAGAAGVLAGLVLLVLPSRTLVLLALLGGIAMIVFSVLALLVVLVLGRRRTTATVA